MLKGKTAVVTGGSRGIGRAVAVKLASLGTNIAILYVHDGNAAEKTCRECVEAGNARAEAYWCDVSDENDVKAVVSSIKKDFGGFHILVNNAGIARDALAVSLKEEDFDRVLKTNLKGAFLMSKHSLPFFLKQKEGAIINISSVSGLMGNAGQSSYAASKAGLIGLTKSLAREYASRQIRCNAVAPGFIATEMTAGLGSRIPMDRIPLGRKGEPEEVAEAVAFLADAGYITGEVLRVDGGFAM